MGYILTDTSPAYELVGDITVSSATTSVSFTGLNFTSADDLLLVSTIIPNGTSPVYYAYINSNTTSTNYYVENFYAYNTSIHGIRYNNSMISYPNTNENVFLNMNIKITNNGYFTYQSNAFRPFNNPTSMLVIDKFYGTSTFTASSITSLQINSSVTSGIGIGSRFRLYKLVAEKVADITVSTATTSVNITGLSIDKGSEYMLVGDWNCVNSNSYLNVFANNNTTITNYWYQLLISDGSTISAGRNNFAPTSLCFLNKKNMFISNIKLTNNGNFVWQSNDIRTYGESGIVLQTFNGTSTFTASSINQITLSSNNANAIGVGSRFQLYKLR